MSTLVRRSNLFWRGYAGVMSALALVMSALLVCTNAPVEAREHPAKIQGRQARNVILFLGDAGGLPTLSAASIYAHDRPQSLFIQSMPYVALSDTSALDSWVTDSAAGMTAIVTGHKTNNGMSSVIPSTNGTVTPVKTVLEYAEERGLSTGVITNMPIWDATPAACYAHVAKRSDKDEIFRQLLAPRYGDGVDILIGKDRDAAEAAFTRTGRTAAETFAGSGYLFGDDPSVLTPKTRRAAILRDEDYAPIPAVEATISSLSRNPKGYFLMVEWDMHTNDLKKGLTHAVEMDNLIRRVSEVVGEDTLILFVADHSYDLKLRSGKRGQPLADQIAADNPDQPKVVAADAKGAHAGEEVVAVAMGPGADSVRGFFSNTQLFNIMMAAFGWKPN
ncbi:alkaline phosphatase [Sphingomonas sp. dw_22]|uniref:alkaline phosphatase n=1 Tax=Sphingomonas sp. dw_22 TaxID=2721175 RepID=UPI002116A6B4|nr:alkaline phosphatase [Sphingomonas sp. dw_22]